LSLVDEGAELRRVGKLIFLCGKMAAGKSTLSKALAKRHDAVLFELDDFLDRRFPEEIVDIASFLTYSARIPEALAQQGGSPGDQMDHGR
jgi:chloramphenicol 3-O-phosphotransferase